MRRSPTPNAHWTFLLCSARPTSKVPGQRCRNARIDLIRIFGFMCKCLFRKCVAGGLLLLLFTSALSGQSLQRNGPTRLTRPATTPQIAKPPTHADILRGEYGRYRANNDLLFYDLDIRVDPEKKFVSGRNTIRFKMLKDDTRIQLDLYDNLKVDKIVFGAATQNGPKSNVQGPTSRTEGTELKYEPDSGAVFIDFPGTLKAV